jgi:predicted alpha/beta-hydrolase family hydrolase
MPAETVALQFRANEQDTVSALLIAPRGHTRLVLAHGAGAGMQHPFMQSLADELGQRGVATLRFQFPYMQNELKRPDSPAIAQTAVRAAVAEASRRLPGVPLFAGGKSYGGRMTSQAQAVDPLPNVVGVVFVGFPLHPAGNPSLKRADHLMQVGVPMLFLQGTRDALADLGLLRVVVGKLGQRAT